MKNAAFLQTYALYRYCRTIVLLLLVGHARFGLATLEPAVKSRKDQYTYTTAPSPGVLSKLTRENFMLFREFKQQPTQEALMQILHGLEAVTEYTAALNHANQPMDQNIPLAKLHYKAQIISAHLRTILTNMNQLNDKKSPKRAYCNQGNTNNNRIAIHISYDNEATEQCVITPQHTIYNVSTQIVTLRRHSH